MSSPASKPSRRHSPLHGLHTSRLARLLDHDAIEVEDKDLRRSTRTSEQSKHRRVDAQALSDQGGERNLPGSLSDITVRDEAKVNVGQAPKC